ncbi:MAG: fumarylacetoacetate hydrolase family protein [Bifidobacteriaceae bacterium]|jgi:2-keto-4-pentenoate hydratase/2-oxohepta-3-ene-1,7-dioic acid hydratase in catechol pathway|nr:fumarylacetoacetate hydrolase family protein [Bifidobacteriaceae bacterium]
MRIARFTLDQDPVYGVVQGQEGDEVIHAIGGDPLYTQIRPTGQTYPIDDVRLLAPVIPRSKVIGVAGNYVSPGGSGPGASRSGGNGSSPIWFGKPNTSVCGPGDPIVLDARVPAPAYHEAELAVVISRLAKDVPADQAFKVVFGYTVANDVGYRYDQADDAVRPDPRGFFGKYRDSFTPLGPWIETDLDPGAGLPVRSWIDGRQGQDGTTGDMVTGIAELVATASSVCTLLPGDVILTGTPAGAGPIAAGDRVTCEVGSLGAITNPVVMR